MCTINSIKSSFQHRVVVVISGRTIRNRLLQTISIVLLSFVSLNNNIKLSYASRPENGKESNRRIWE